MSESADPGAVERFRQEGSLPEDAVPVASLTVLWYLEPDGRDTFLYGFDGRQRVSETVGDVVAVIHDLLHSDGGPDPLDA